MMSACYQKRLICDEEKRTLKLQDFFHFVLNRPEALSNRFVIYVGCFFYFSPLSQIKIKIIIITSCFQGLCLSLLCQNCSYISALVSQYEYKHVKIEIKEDKLKSRHSFSAVSTWSQGVLFSSSPAFSHIWSQPSLVNVGKRYIKTWLWIPIRFYLSNSWGETTCCFIVVSFKELRKVSDLRPTHGVGVGAGMLLGWGIVFLFICIRN